MIGALTIAAFVFAGFSNGLPTGTWVVRGPEGAIILVITGDGHYALDVTGDGVPEVEGVLLENDAGQIVFRDTAGVTACPETALYSAHVFDDGTLRFEFVEDSCPGRRSTMSLLEWVGVDRLDGAESAIERGEGSADAYILRGRIRLMQGEFESAQADLDHALELQPDNARALAALAGLKLIEGQDLGGALTYFDRAIDAAPGDGLRYFQRAFVKYHSGDTKGACTDLSAAIERGLPVKERYTSNCTEGQ